jgi:hypothetical protein
VFDTEPDRNKEESYGRRILPRGNRPYVVLSEDLTIQGKSGERRDEFNKRYES